MHKNLGRIAVLLCCILLAGCSAPFPGSQNVEELLRAPQPGQGESAVLSALNQYLGEALQLKYPRTGRVPEPVIFADFDGSGTEEAAVLYTTESKGKNVHLAILEQTEDGWEVGYEVRGLATEVAELDAVHLLDGSVQLIVGYANTNLTDKYLEVYDYRDVTLYSICRQPYDTYFFGDVKNNGKTALAVASRPEEPGAAMIRVLQPAGRALAQVCETALNEQLEECTSIRPTHSRTEKGLVVDGRTSDGMAASQLLRWNEGNVLVQCPQKAEDAAEAFVRSRRPQNVQVLSPADLDKTGQILIPEVGPSIPTLQSTKRFYPVEWMDYLNPAPLRQYGIYDAEYDYFLRLPEAWKDKITISVYDEDFWQVRSKRNNDMLCSIRILPVNAMNGVYLEATRLKDLKVTLSFGENCSPSECNLIRRGVLAIED